MPKEFFGKKIGMTQIFGGEGELFPVTLLEVEPVYLLEKVESGGKLIARIGCFAVDEKKAAKIKKPQQGYFKKIKAPFFRVIKEVKAQEEVFENQGQEAGEKKEESQGQESKEKNQEIEKASGQKEESKNSLPFFGVEVFKLGEKITVKAKTKGKGFAGPVKRHGTHRQPSSHGSGMHRRVGSVGACATPSRIMKNKKMPGHLGAVYRVTKNLEILKIDTNNRLIFVKGNVPGRREAIVKISKQS